MSKVAPAFLLTLFFCLNASPGARNPHAQFLWLSDIHFNPFDDPALVDKLSASSAADWPAILNSSSRAKFSSFGQDANWPLLSSALSAIKRTVPAPTFTIVTGDLMAHHFREQFDATATVHDDSSFGRFAKKTVEFIGLQMKQLSPDTRSIIALGNNDSECGDYLTQSDGAFLRSTGPSIAALAGATDVSAFSASWNKFGSFSVPNPVLRKHRMIVLDTTFLSSRHRNGCSATSADAGNAMLIWLTHELAGARQHGEKVWLIYHIPPGIDGFATLHSKTASGNPVTFWKNPYSTNFEELSKQYRGTIEASFAGHTHLDDFRLMDKGGRSRSVVVVNPALGPNVRQNPSFRVVTLGSHGTLEDQATYYLGNLASISPQVPADWKLEYSFNQAWGLHGINAASYEKLWRRVEKSPKDRAQWVLFYSVSTSVTFIAAEDFRIYHCASGYTNAKDFQDCAGVTAVKSQK